MVIPNRKLIEYLTVDERGAYMRLVGLGYGRKGGRHGSYLDWLTDGEYVEHERLLDIAEGRKAGAKRPLCGAPVTASEQTLAERADPLQTDPLRDGGRER